MLVVNSTQFSALKINTRSPNLYEFIPDAHGCPMGVQGPMGSMKNLMIQGILGINFTALFTTKGYIRMDADYSFVLNSSETLASTFFGHITLFLGSVYIYS